MKTVFLSFIMLLAVLAIAAKIGDNTLNLGDKTATDKFIKFKEGSALNPQFKWDEASSKIQVSHDGTIFTTVGEGGGGGAHEAIQGYTIIGNVGDVGNQMAGHIWETDEGGANDIALYLFENGGSLTTDTSGSFTLNNVGASTAANGILGSGFATELNGSTQTYFSVDLLDTVPTDLLIDMWVKFDDGQPSGNIKIFKKLNISAASDLVIAQLETTGEISFIVRSGASAFTIKSSTILPNGVTDWVHLGFSWSTSSGISLYLGGVREDQNSSVTTLMANGSFSDFYIGSDLDTGQYLDGIIGMFRVRAIDVTRKDIDLSTATKYAIPGSFSDEEFTIYPLLKKDGDDDFISQMTWGGLEVLRNTVGGFFYRYSYIFNANDKLKLYGIE